MSGGSEGHGGNYGELFGVPAQPGPPGPAKPESHAEQMRFFAARTRDVLGDDPAFAYLVGRPGIGSGMGVEVLAAVGRLGVAEVIRHAAQQICEGRAKADDAIRLATSYVAWLNGRNDVRALADEVHWTVVSFMSRHAAMTDEQALEAIRGAASAFEVEARRRTNNAAPPAPSAN